MTNPLILNFDPGTTLLSTIDGNVRELELTKTQYEQMESAYSGVTKWLASSDDPYLQSIDLYSQGSVRLRTTVRPLNKDEFDLDFICFLPEADSSIMNPDTLYQTIWNRMKEHETYKQMIEPMNRCIRLNYAEESKFHMDITPAIPNYSCANNGILVPDRERKSYKPSNPIEYANQFDNISQLVPAFKSMELAEFREALNRASIEPLPDPLKPKDILRRLVQLSKRHRDLYFENKDGYPPISIIITTLLMASYGNQTQFTQSSLLEFVLNVIKELPRYIITENSTFYIPNPSATDENFAEKWNDDQQRALSFSEWHKAFVADVEELTGAQGIDKILPILENKLIGKESSIWHRKTLKSVSQGRENGSLKRAAGIGGLTLSSSVAGATVKKNTFYGD